MESTVERIAANLYGGDVLIQFTPGNHRYCLEGSKQPLPSVTSVTGIIDKSRGLIPWAVSMGIGHVREYLNTAEINSFTREELFPILDEAMRKHESERDAAATTGDLVHAWAETFAQAKMMGIDPPPILDEYGTEVINGINAFLDWYLENDVRIIECERIIYSRRHGYVGKCDAIAKVNGNMYLLDYKTGKGIYSEAYLQVAAYTSAYEEENGNVLDGSMILHFGKETGEFKSVLIGFKENRKNFKGFLSALTLQTRIKDIEKNLRKY